MRICRPFGTDHAILIFYPVTEVTGYFYSVPSGLGPPSRLRGLRHPAGTLSELGFMGSAGCLGWKPDNGVAVARL